MTEASFVPPGFLKLRDAVDLTGQHCHGAAWTGREIQQLGYPPPKKPSDRLEAAVNQLRGLLALGRVPAIAIAENGKQFSVPVTLWLSEDGRRTFDTGLLPAGDLREALQARGNRTERRQILVFEYQLQTALAEPVSVPRSQVNRKAATKQRNEAIQTAAEEIWSEEYKETGKILTKETVAMHLLDKAKADETLRNHCQDHKTQGGGLLAEDTLRRLISVPDWVSGKRSRKR